MVGRWNWIKNHVVFSNLFHQVGRHGIAILIIIFLLSGGTWAFVELVENVQAGDTQTFDEKIILLMRTPGDTSDPVGPDWMEEFGRDLTALGGVAVMSLLTFFAIGYLVLERKYRMALLIAIAVGGGIFFSTLLKQGFDRPRPMLVPHESYVYTSSFPSGHSMISAITYLTLAALLAQVHRRKRVKIYLLIVAALLTFLVGISRIYMGVHWPTDVLAGWTAGALWALLCWLLGWWLQQRGKVEQEGSEGETAAAV
ncbi:MAG: phosphatase PAP2 family protein [Calditrichia bacterium]